MTQIMIIEDDQTIRDELALLLENEGCQPLPVTDFDSVPVQAAQAHPDLILPDINLPGRDGFALCTRFAEGRPRAGDLCHQPGFRGGRGAGAEPGRRRLHHKALQRSHTAGPDQSSSAPEERRTGSSRRIGAA